MGTWARQRKSRRGAERAPARSLRPEDSSRHWIAVDLARNPHPMRDLVRTNRDQRGIHRGRQDLDLHARAYTGNERARIAAIADPNEVNRQTRGDQWGVAGDKQYADASDLIADDSIDMVEVLVPHNLHLPITLAAMEAGKAVALQKPMALSVAEADQIRQGTVHRGGVQGL